MGPDLFDYKMIQKNRYYLKTKDERDITIIFRN